MMGREGLVGDTCQAPGRKKASVESCIQKFRGRAQTKNFRENAGLNFTVEKGEDNGNHLDQCRKRTGV